MGADSMADDPDVASEKKRRLATSDFTRRKRAATACQFCRVRKTKCDNVRPTCGYCVRHKARCVYGDEDLIEETSFVGGPLIESGAVGQQILERLDELKTMMQQQQSHHVASTPSAPTPGTMRPPVTSTESFGQSPWTGASDVSSHQTPGTSTALSPASPYTTARCEAFLRWPVLRGIVPESSARIDSFLLDAADVDAGESSAPKRAARGIREEAFVPLCGKFLAEVHPRNPILDGRELMRHARDAEEHGLKWNSASCLVLLACALATSSRAWEKPPDQPWPANIDEVDLHAFALPGSEERAEADAYFEAARKRLGLLGYSIDDIQCLFLASVYEKFYLRPLQAWFFMQQASARLQAHLLRRGERPWASFQRPGPGNHLEQRVFWSCFRAENELLLEIGLRCSGLEDFAYPDALPAPPEPAATPHSEAGTLGWSPASDDQQRRVDEMGWYFYLAEISLRRTIDETVRVLYGKGEEFWVDNPALLVQQYHEFEQQISMWQYHLPASVRFDEHKLPDNEFACYIQYRFQEWHEFVLRPILYHVLHRQPGLQAATVSRETTQLAAKAVDVCATIITHAWAGGQKQQRHGGSWFASRRMFSCVCVILAVVQQPGRGLRPPPNWRSLVERAIRIIEVWSDEAADVRCMATTIEYMYRQVRDPPEEYSQRPLQAEFIPFRDV